MQPLSTRFFRRDAETVARDLLGHLLVHESPEGTTMGRIVETEAYAGPHDRAAHVTGGRRTPRTEVFWQPGGVAYVYLIYGMHHCFNVVTGKKDEPSAVLIRAVRPLKGTPVMAQRRGRDMDDDALLIQNGKRPPRRLVELTSGPGRLAEAFDLKRRHTGTPLTQPPLFIARGKRVADPRVGRTRRVGVDYAGEDALLEYRYYVLGDAFVSRPWPKPQQAAISGANGTKR